MAVTDVLYEEVDDIRLKNMLIFNEIISIRKELLDIKSYINNIIKVIESNKTPVDFWDRHINNRVAEQLPF